MLFSTIQFVLLTACALMGALGVASWARGQRAIRRAQQLEQTLENKDAMAKADAAGPRTDDAVGKRLRDGTF